MNVFVTGGAGYVGSVLVPFLLGHGHRVRVLDDFRHGENSLSACVHDAKFECFVGDARDERMLKPHVAWADVVVPLAAVVGFPACERDRDGAISTNVKAIATLVDLLGTAQGIVYPNTNSGYGVGGEELCDEASPMLPLSLYGTTKLNAERYVVERFANSGRSRNAIVFRLATVFGPSPRMRLDLLVNDFVFRAVRDKALVVFEGHFRRNFVHVCDVARAFCRAIVDFDVMGGYAFNVGDDRANMTKLELCARIREQVPNFAYVESAIGEDPDKRDYVVSNERIKATGWSPAYSIDDGIKQLVAQSLMLKNSRYANV